MKRHNTSTELEKKLWKLLHQTHYIIAKAREIEISEYELSLTRDSILSILVGMDTAPTLTEISHKILREPSSVSEIVNRMESHGLVKKKKGSNKSKVYLEITAKGERAYKKSMEMPIIHCIFSDLSIEQQQEMYSNLLKCRRKALREMAQEITNLS